ncbi:MAG TPA: LD-carboxypeptidase, partial [Erythrobacter sp.]|nr:LD-carboxypeptidase [Erythrobacter sp.]
FDGAILFLEDINEEPYRIDRMLQQLQLAGVLDRLAGVVFGQCTRCSAGDADARTFMLDDVLGAHLAPLGIPVVTGFNSGHVRNQLCLPVNVPVELDAGARTLRMLEPAVA